MSWNAYTDSLITQGQTAGAVIVGFPDGGLWAASGALALQGTEGKVMAERFANPRSGAKLVAGGVSYMATNCTEDFLTGRAGQNGICVTKSGKACIITFYKEGMNAGSCMDHNTKMSADLASKGF